MRITCVDISKVVKVVSVPVVFIVFSSGCYFSPTSIRIELCKISHTQLYLGHCNVMSFVST